MVKFNSTFSRRQKIAELTQLAGLGDPTARDELQTLLRTPMVVPVTTEPATEPIQPQPSPLPTQSTTEPINPPRSTEPIQSSPLPTQSTTEPINPPRCETDADEGLVVPFTRILGEAGDSTSIKGSFDLLAEPLGINDVIPSAHTGNHSVRRWLQVLQKSGSREFVRRMIATSDDLLHQCMQITEYSVMMFALARGPAKTRMGPIVSQYTMDSINEGPYRYDSMSTINTVS